MKIDKYLLAAGLVFMIGIFFVCCSSIIKPSSLLDDKEVPVSCRIILDWVNQSQKSTEGQSFITGSVGSICKADLALLSCVKEYERIKKDNPKKSFLLNEKNLILERCLKFYVN